MEKEFAAVERPVPLGWERSAFEEWLIYRPHNSTLPSQGWKIHSSARIDNAERILDAVWEYCVAHLVPFKFIRNERLLLFRNGKSADRASSAKFITIYPRSETQFERILNELGAVLDGYPAPYILSDLRWKAGPLYVRYGAFIRRTVTMPNGEVEQAIENAEGHLVSDRRGATFESPPWIVLPSCLRCHLAARNLTTVEHLQYKIERALHFTNAGGVYVAVDRRTSQRVVLKEARPHAGLTLDGADALVRLRHERVVLEQLSGLEGVPEVRDYFRLEGHEFLVEDFIDAPTLNSRFVRRYPLTSQKRDDAAVAEYTSWVLRVARNVERVVAAVHDRGVVIADLHPSNILVRADDEVVIVDWESAHGVASERPASLGAPGFIAPQDRKGFDIDRYALACLRLHLLLPLTRLFDLDPCKVGQLETVITDQFPLARVFTAEAISVIRGAASPTGSREPKSGQAIDVDPAICAQARDSMSRAILKSATPRRDDRLFPGDVAQFEPGGGLNIASGAAGILYVLSVVGAGRYPDHEDWLVRHVRLESDSPLGFYDGLHGVAYVLDRLGRRSDALNVLDICMEQLGGGWEQRLLDLGSGLSGIGLNLVHFGITTGDPALCSAAWRIVDVIVDRLGKLDDAPVISGGRHPRAGLLKGWSGPALFLLRMFELCGDRRLLHSAATALRRDLRRCLRRRDGTLHINEGWRTLPYLGNGSIGIGMVLDDYLAHQRNEELMEAAAAIRGAAEATFFIQSGLFAGRAGIVLYLSRSRSLGAASPDAVLAVQVRRLAWHSLNYQGDLVFPGDQLLRLSMDLGTGTAGVWPRDDAACHFWTFRGCLWTAVARPARVNRLAPRLTWT